MTSLDKIVTEPKTGEDVDFAIPERIVDILKQIDPLVLDNEYVVHETAGLNYPIENRELISGFINAIYILKFKALED